MQKKSWRGSALDGRPKGAHAAPMDRATLGSYIKERRARARLTQVQLAEVIGVSERTMIRIERGDVGVSAERLARIGAALGFTLDEAAKASAPKRPTRRVRSPKRR